MCFEHVIKRVFITSILFNIYNVKCSFVLNCYLLFFNSFLLFNNFLINTYKTNYTLLTFTIVLIYKNTNV